MIMIFFHTAIGLSTFQDTFREVAHRLKKETSDLHLLDAGCGSGNHLEVFQNDVGEISGLEINDGMISKCRAKLPHANIQQGSITDMPFEDNSVDVIITTQVLHHLETGEDQTFPNVQLAAAEVFRCLRPNGAWVVQTQTPEQHIDGFWWAPVVPNASQELSTHFAPLDVFEDICHDTGFGGIASTIPSQPLVRLDKYLDIEGPFTEGFRNADSTWSLATEDELEKGLLMLRQKIDSGVAEEWLVEREAIRAEIGQTTTVVASKIKKGKSTLVRKSWPLTRSFSFR